MVCSPNVSQKGRWSPAFPVHVECHTFDDAQAVLGLQEGVLALLMRYRIEERANIAEAVQAIPGFSKILEGVSPWLVILNGVSFKGILLNEE